MLFSLIAKSYQKKVDAIGLAVFRLFYAALVCLQVAHILYFQHLIFAHHSPARILGLWAWLAACVLLMIGYRTRAAAVLNYLLTLVYIDTQSAFSYDFDKIMTTMNFLLMFIPVSRCLSLDSYLAGKRGRPVPQTTTVLSYTLPVFLCLGLPYFDSFYHKIHSANWLSGIGLWVPASMPHFTWMPWIDYAPFLDQRFFIYAANYIVLVFEAVFIFTFWFKQARWILWTGGIVMHLGILLIFPIPLFALGCMTVYILLLPSGLFRKVWPARREPLKPAGDDGKSGDEKPWIFLITVFVVYCVAMQACYFFDYSYSDRYGYGMPGMKREASVRPGSNAAPEKFDSLNQLFLFSSKKFFGIGNHDVFVDYHVNHYDVMLAVCHRAPDGRETWLPIIQPDGHPGLYNTDRLWSKWTADVVGPTVSTSNLHQGIMAYVEMWCRHDQNRCEAGYFVVKERPVITPGRWQKGMARLQAQAAWKDVGRIFMDNEKVILDLTFRGQRHFLGYQRKPNG